MGAWLGGSPKPGLVIFCASVAAPAALPGCGGPSIFVFNRKIAEGLRERPLVNYNNRSNLMIEDLLQPRHLLIILAVALFLFGPKKLPELGKGLAQGIRGFKDAIKPAAPQD
jgi:sec-independent protein translocase protein TatA